MNSNLTKAQCVSEINRLDRLISYHASNPVVSLAYVEQRIWWIERLGELNKGEGYYPGRKFNTKR